MFFILGQEEHRPPMDLNSRQGTGCTYDILQLYDTAKEGFATRDTDEWATYMQGTCSIQSSIRQLFQHRRFQPRPFIGTSFATHGRQVQSSALPMQHSHKEYIQQINKKLDWEGRM